MNQRSGSLPYHSLQGDLDKQQDKKEECPFWKLWKENEQYPTRFLSSLLTFLYVVQDHLSTVAITQFIVLATTQLGRTQICTFLPTNSTAKLEYQGTKLSPNLKCTLLLCTHLIC